MPDIALALDFTNVNVHSPHTDSLHHHHNSHNATQLTTNASHNDSSVYHPDHSNLLQRDRKSHPATVQEIPPAGNIAENHDTDGQVYEAENINDVTQYYQRLKKSKREAEQRVLHSMSNPSSQSPESPSPFPPTNWNANKLPIPATSSSLRFKSNNPFRFLVQQPVECGCNREERRSPPPCPICGSLPALTRGQDASRVAWPKESPSDPLPPFSYPVNTFHGPGSTDTSCAGSHAVFCAPIYVPYARHFAPCWHTLHAGCSAPQTAPSRPHTLHFPSHRNSSPITYNAQDCPHISGVSDDDLVCFWCRHFGHP